MAKIDGRSKEAKALKAEQDIAVSDTIPVVITPSEEPTTPAPKKDANAAILERLERLEASNKAKDEQIAKLSEEKENTFKKSKERYEGPRHYSFSLWGGKPVCDYVTVLKDPTKDLQYNERGIDINNQMLRLTFSDGETMDVDVIEYGKHKKLSEKQEAEVLSNGSKPSGYRFTNSEGSFIVSPKAIN